MLTDRRYVQQAREAIVDTLPEYGTIHTQLDVRKKDGGIYKLEVVNPFALLHTVLLHCAVFAQAFSAAVVARTPSFTSPWHIALYGDEVVPSNPLKGQNFRKKKRTRFIGASQSWGTAYWRAKQRGSVLLAYGHRN